jgi:signal transduction histidine kinase
VLNYAVSRGHQALREAADAAQARALALSQRNARELEARVAERTADIAAAMRQVEGSLALERSLRARQREFFATVSHELRTPLAVIDTSAQNLALAQPPLPEAAHGRVDKILAAAQRLAALLDRQLRDEPGTDEAPAAHPRTCAVADLLREATASARLLGDDHRLQIDAPADGESFECDPELTRLALANLVENAVKYTPAGTTVKVRARREGQRATDALLIEVVDDGPGIPPSARPRLFFAPWRGEAAAGVAGTGLGLMLAQRMVQAQGGTLELLDRDGGGTVARIRLPTGPAAAHPSSTIAANS